eukprot:487057_1
MIRRISIYDRKNIQHDVAMPCALISLLCFSIGAICMFVDYMFDGNGVGFVGGLYHIWCWALLVWKIIQVVKSKRSIYYTSLPPKKHGFIFLIATIILIAVSLHDIKYRIDDRHYYFYRHYPWRDMLLNINALLYEFVGIQTFVSISWIFDLQIKRCRCANKIWFTLMRIIVIIGLLTMLLIFALGSTTESEFTLVQIWFVLFTTMGVVVNFILFILLTRFATALLHLLENDYVKNTFDQDVYTQYIKQKQKKKNLQYNKQK